LIRNEKPVDPTQPDSPLVYQLETAMGLAIAIFPDAQAVQVPRTRFLPVKTTDDLLALWSDAYVLDDDSRILPNPAREVDQEPLVELDERYYQLFEQIQERFPHGAPSLLHCSRLQVSGNVYFGANVVLKGDVQIRHPGEEPFQIEDGRLIQDEHFRA
jgi:UTP--glucose-1-phosphate uridylyltransferase